MSYIHLKLDKLVAGKEKRLFKSNLTSYSNTVMDEKSQAINKNITQNKDNIKQLFYGNQTINDNKLLKFNDVSTQYVTEKNVMNINEFSDINSYYRQLMDQNLKYPENQEIQYFQSTLEKPIDIAGVEDMAYMLSPFGNRKNVQIFSQPFNLQMKDVILSADFKENYSSAINYVFDRTTSNPQFNTIPLYDMTFTNLQTILFQTEDRLTTWLKKYKFTEFIFDNNVVSAYICMNVNNTFPTFGYDSINIRKLFQVLTYFQNNHFFTEAIQKQLIKQLVDNLNESSFNCYMSVIGNVSKLSDTTKTAMLTSDIISSPINENTNLLECFTNPLQQLYTVNNIPNNSLYIMDTHSKFVSTPQKYSKLSAYLNYVNLKNYQTPQEDFEISTPENMFSQDFVLKGNNTNSAYININQHTVYNYDIVNKFDIDKTKSLEFNTTDIKANHIIPTKNVVSSILADSIYYDTYYRGLQQMSAYYNMIDTMPIHTKVNDYLIPFNEYHIQDNKSYETGQLDGIRNYLNVGIIDNYDNIWLSYKYVTTKSNQLTQYYSDIYHLPFNTYNINRTKYQMQQLKGQTLYKGQNEFRITKQKNQICPWLKYNTDLSGIFKCTASSSDQCVGYCTFPLEHKYLDDYQPKGKRWQYTQFKETTNDQEDTTIFSSINNEWFYFNIKHNYASLYANQDIYVTDDIEIYFSNIPFKQFTQFVQKNGPYYKAIYNGFGRSDTKILTENLFVNNTDIVKKENYTKYPINQQFQTIQEYSKKFILIKQNSSLANLFDKPLYFFINETYLNNVKLSIPRDVFSKSLKSFIMEDSRNIKYRNLCNINYFNLLNNPTGIVNIDFLNNVSYYKLYTMSFYDIIKDLYIYSNVKISNLPQLIYQTDDSLYYKDFRITNKSPFNGPHKIAKGQLISGLSITKDINGNIIVSPEKITTVDTINIKNKVYCYIRVVNWWSDNIKAEGSIIVKYDIAKQQNDTTYMNILNTINNFDHVEKVDGFFKSSQKDYKKSNIYSIKVENSGLNPQLDIMQEDFCQYLLLRNYAYLDKTTQQYYKFLSYQEFIKLENNNFDTGNTLIIYKLLQVNQDNTNGINVVKDFSQYYNYDVNNQLIAKDKISESKAYTYIKNQGGIYYLDKQYVKRLIKARNDIREIFETAIKSSVHKYMPVHTDLWKIIYK